MEEQAIDPPPLPPFYSEARAYCDRLYRDDISAGDFENVRLSMCHREYMRRIQPWLQKLAYMAAFDLPGYAKTPSRIEAEALIAELMSMHAKELGLSFALTYEDAIRSGLPPSPAT